MQERDYIACGLATASISEAKCREIEEHRLKCRAAIRAAIDPFLANVKAKSTRARRGRDAAP